MAKNKKANKKVTNKKATQQKVQKAIIAPVVVAGLLINSTAPTVALASPLLVEIQKHEVVVVYKNDSGKQKVLDKAIEVKDELGSLKAISVVLTESAIRSLEKDPDIGYVERKLEEEIQLLGTPGQWGVEDVNAPTAWAEGITGQGVKVAIIDSGIAVHSELPNVVQRVSFFQDLNGQADVAPYDTNGHGTHVAGIVGAKNNNKAILGDGSEVIGVAPNVSLYSLKVTEGQEQGTVLDVIEAIDWAIANNMDVINLSLGLDTHVQLLQDAVDRAYQAGIVVVGAAGNDGNGTPVNYPAKYDSVIAVGSVDTNKSISSFSSTGSEIEFTAPGGGVISTYSNNGTATYASVGGTSQASPHVAGFVALLMQKDSSKSANEIRVELQKYVDDLGEEGRDELYGYGFIDYTAYDETAPAEVTDLQEGEKTTESITVTWTNPTDEDFAKAVVLVNGEVVGETTDKTQNTFTIEALQPGTEYHVEVKTVDAKGNESVGASLSVSTEADVTAPADVTDLVAIETTINSASISYTLPTDEDFEIANIYVDGVLYGQTAGTTYEIQELVSSTDYTVKVTTVDKTGNESVGQEITVTTQSDVDETAPAEVTSLIATDVTDSSFLLTWTNPTDEDFILATIYQVDETGEEYMVASSEDGTFLFEWMEANTEYDIIVRTMDAEGNESVGQTITVKTEQKLDTTAPAEVSNLTATEVTHNSAKLTFTNPSDEDYTSSLVYVNGEYVGETSTGEYVLTGLDPLTEYQVVVTTIDGSLNESTGQSVAVKTVDVPDTTAPAEVTGLVVDEATHNSITVSYATPSDEDFAKVNFYVNGELVAESTSTTHTFENLTPETAYDVEIRTVDEAGNESVGTSVRVYTVQEPDTTAPAEVTGLEVVESTTDSITVSFANPTDEDFVQTNFYLNGDLVGNTTSNTFTFENLTAETIYSIVAKTVDADGNESEGVSVTTGTKAIPDTTAPAEVTGIEVVDALINSITIGWTNPTDEDFKGTNVYLNGVLQGFIDKAEESLFTFLNLVAGTDYVIETRTVDETGNESEGVQTTVSTQEEPDTNAPAEVTELKATTVTADRIEISFVNPSDEDFAKANIYVDGELVGSTTSTAYAIGDVASETQYEITVKTVDEEGNESVGEVITVKTPDVTAPNEVTEMQVSNVTETSALVTFNNPSNEDFATAKVFVNGEFVGETTEGSYELTNLEAKTSYTVKVTTVDATGNESNGQTVTVETLDMTAPNEVTGLEVTESTTDSITVSFTNPSDEDFVQTNFYLNGDLVGNTTSETFTFNGLTAETVYSIVAKTVDVQGNESEGVAVTTATKEIPDTFAPAEVTGLEATAVTFESMNLSFVNPTDEDFAKAIIYVNGEFAGETTSGTYELSELTAETSYEIIVKTVDQLGNVSVGETINVTTKEVPDTFAPAEVTELEANATTNSATITFTNPSDEDFAKANVYVNGELHGETTSGTYELSDLTAETTYEVVVKTVDVKGNESVGATISVVTEAEPIVEEPTEPTPTEPTEPSEPSEPTPTEPTEPEEPSEPTPTEPTEPEQPVEPEPTPEPVDETAPAEVTEALAKDITTTSAVISWTTPTDEDFAMTNIYVNGEKVQSVAKGEEANFEMTGLTTETSYEVVIKTVDESGNESEGQVVVFSTEAEPVVEEPTEPTPTEPEQPTEPTEPAEPTEPEPTEPTPTEPEQPEEPSEPEQPVDPEPTPEPQPEPIDEIAPAEASDVQATDVTVNSAVISWDIPTDEDFEATNIYVDGVLVKTVEKGAESTFILEGLDSETAYKVVVKTVDANGNESEGIELNLTTLAEVVDEPTPTEPTEPSQPSEPTPTEPTEPEEPSEPAPTEPTEPEEPSEPSEPTPTEPTEPEQPSEPSEPTPTEPTEPEEPSEPAPTEPEQPTDPVEPEPTPEPQPEQPPVDETAPAEVTDVNAVDVTTDSATISWDIPTDEDFESTNIYVNGELVQTLGKDVTTFTLEELDSNTDYKVVIKTVDADGNESEGVELTLTTEKEVEVIEPTPEPQPTPEPTEEEEEKGFFEKIVEGFKNAIESVVEGIADFFSSDEEEKEQLPIQEDFSIAYDLKEHLDAEQKAKIEEYVDTIQLQEITSEMEFAKELESIGANKNIKLTFQEAINPSSLTGEDVIIRHNGAEIPDSDFDMVVSEDGKTVTFTTPNNFEPGKYSLFIDNSGLEAEGGAKVKNPVVVVFHLQ